MEGFDYSSCGAYFVTIVTRGRECLFGEVVEGEMRLNELGKVVADIWQWLERQYEHIELGTWVVMPNHFHGIIFIKDYDSTGGSRTARTESRRKPLGRLIGAFKTVSTKRINLLRKTPGAILWHRDFYDHIIRNQQDLELTWLYIESNPARWSREAKNPAKR